MDSGRSTRPGHSIGGLAAAAGVTVSTIRFYERRGLLSPALRLTNRYRVYDAAAIERLRLIRAAQDAGFTLDDIVRLLAMSEGDATACGDMRMLLRLRQDRIDAELARLRHARRLLRRLAISCERAAEAAPCPSLRTLKHLAQRRRRTASKVP